MDPVIDWTSSGHIDSENQFFRVSATARDINILT